MALLSLIGRIGLDTSSFEGGLKRVESAAGQTAVNLHQKLGATLAGIFSVAAVQQMVERVHDLQTEIGQLSKQYSLTTDEVQLLTKAAGRLHMEFGDVAGAIERVNKLRSEAAQGGTVGQRAADTFNKLGVTDRDIVDQSKSVVDLLMQIGKTARENSKNLEVQNAEFELLGKSAISLRNVMVELTKLGPVTLIDPDDIARAEEVDRLMKARKRELAAAAAPISSAWDRFKLGSISGAQEFWNMPDQMGWSKWSLKSGVARGFSPFLGMLQGLADVISPSEEFGSALPETEKAIAKRDQKARISADAAKIRAVATPDEVVKVSQVHGSAIRNGSGSLANVGGYFFGDSANQKLTEASVKTARATTEILSEMKQLSHKIDGSAQ